MQNTFATLYMLAFAGCGILIARPIFRKDDGIRRLFYGLVCGLVLLIWLPAVYAFIFKSFTKTVQFISLGTAAAIAAAATVISCVKFKGDHRKYEKGELKAQLLPLLAAAVPLVFICFTLHIGHTITNASDGSLHVGQCTYGDLCMHLGFISSISVQQTFPPMYSILPDTPLGYPFLCDSVSSTFYTLGASLRLSALLPALYACLVTVLGVYLFFETWFKKRSSAVLATYIFFIGGGFGFWYFLNNRQLLLNSGVDRMQELMEGFYKMPTNMPGEGLRWVNAIADMLLPQRATLFGWALLFPALELLYRGAVEKENRVLIPLGVIAGAMPLVHTHSFLALGIISAVLFIANLLQYLIIRRDDRNSRLAIRSAGCFIAMALLAVLHRLEIPETAENLRLLVPAVFSAVLAVMAVLLASIEIFRSMRAGKGGTLPAVLVLISGAVGAATLLGYRSGSMLSFASPVIGVLACIVLTVLPLDRAREAGLETADADGEYEDAETETRIRAERKSLLFFALFGVITLVLAAPQLFGFTLKQSGNNASFLRWNLNWDNVSDSYLWFYIKNLGLIFLLMPAAFFCLKRRDRVFYSGGIAIWAICEILLFQPNPYDNNKLLFVWFALTCGIVGDFLIKHLGGAARNAEGRVDIRRTLARVSLMLIACFALFTSGVMTLAREYVSADHYGVVDKDGLTYFGKVESGYELTPEYQVELTEWIKANTAPDATFLTYNNHNNAIAMLTGRNLFVGSPTFLHFHGVNYAPRAELLDDMYEHPSLCLFEYAREYGIDYVLVGPEERWMYHVSSKWFRLNLECVFKNEQLKLYKLPDEDDPRWYEPAPAEEDPEWDAPDWDDPEWNNYVPEWDEGEQYELPPGETGTELNDPVPAPETPETYPE